MRVEDLRAGTLVNGERVTGKRRGWNNGRTTITVTFGHAGPGETPNERTYNVGQDVPGSPRMTAAFMPASDHHAARARNGRPDLYRDETARERQERRTALRLALAAA